MKEFVIAAKRRKEEKEEEEKRKVRSPSQRSISDDPHAHQIGSWSALNTTKPRTKAGEAHCSPKSFGKLLAGIVKCHQTDIFLASV